MGWEGLGGHAVLSHLPFPFIAGGKKHVKAWKDGNVGRKSTHPGTIFHTYTQLRGGIGGGGRSEGSG